MIYARWLDPRPHWLPGYCPLGMEEEIIRWRFPKIASFSQVAYGRILRALSLSGAWKVHVKLYYRIKYFELPLFALPSSCEKQEIPKFKSEKTKTRGTFCFQVVVNLPGYSQTTRLEQCYYPRAQVAGTIKYFSQFPWCSALTCPASQYLLRVFRWIKLSDELVGKDILC